MGLVVRSDVVAMTTARHLGVAHARAGTTVERLSTGLWVNRAADDAAGLAISEGLRSQVNGIRVGLRGAQDAISTLTVADAALGTTHEVLRRLRDLTIQAMNPINPVPSHEIGELLEALDQIAATRDLTGNAMFTGGYAALFTVGADMGDAITARITLDASATGLGVGVLRGLGGVLSDVVAVAGRADAPGVPGSASTFDLSLADDAAVAALVGGLASPATDVTVAGRTIDLTGVTTRTALAAALTGGDTTAEVTATGVRVSATSNSADLITVVGLTGTHMAGAADVPPVTGNAAAVSGKVTLATPTGRVVDVDGTFLELTDLADDMAAAASSAERAEILRTALEATFTGTTATVASDGTFTLTTTGNADAVLDALPLTAADALDALDTAISRVSTARAQIGATHNRFEHAIAAQQVALENLAAARGRIVDADMAAEAATLSRSQVAAQAASALLGQTAQARRDMLAALLR